MQTKRMFLALPLTPSEKAEIDHWRAQLNWPFKAVVKDNLHITLVFLGQVSSTQEKEIMAQCNAIQAQGFQITLSELSFWQKPKINVLNVRDTPTPLAELVKDLTNGALNAGLNIEQRRYRPHLTLFRKATNLPTPAQLNMNIQCKYFCLYHSYSGEQGVIYDEVARWSLVE